MYFTQHRKEDFAIKETIGWAFFWLLISITFILYEHVVQTSIQGGLQSLQIFLTFGLIIYSTFGRISNPAKIAFVVFWAIVIYLPITRVIDFYLRDNEMYPLSWVILNGAVGFSAFALLIFTPPEKELKQIKPIRHIHYILPVLLTSIVFELRIYNNWQIFVLTVSVGVFLWFINTFIKKIPSFLTGGIIAFILIYSPLLADGKMIAVMILSVLVFSILLVKLHPMLADPGFWVCSIHATTGFLATVTYLLVVPVGSGKLFMLLLVNASFAWSLMGSFMLLSLLNRIVGARF
ncbi:MAG: hypothetical protein PWR20_2395 [Bacteroidales bacterium]|jgi:hypothetical protein|nr:hypothetical protein [Bacteroidales bacterium]MDN5329779.1 hypothetical protein [Bacteroidales bacterium]